MYDNHAMDLITVITVKCEHSLSSRSNTSLACAMHLLSKHVKSSWEQTARYLSRWTSLELRRKEIKCTYTYLLH